MTRPSRILKLSFMVALVLALAVPAVASAATVVEYQLQYEPLADPSGSLLIVTAIADPQTKLPVTVTVPAPKGSRLLWAGEVLGGDAANDPSRETTFTTVGDMDVYTVTLEQAYTAQLEFNLAPATVSGRKLESSLMWTNPGEEAPVAGGVIVEAGAKDVQVTPKGTGSPQTNENGQALYTFAGKRLAKGDSIKIQANWKRAAASGTPDKLPYVLGLLVVAVLALAIVLVRERTRARRASARGE